MRDTSFEQVRLRVDRELKARGGVMRQLAREIAERDGVKVDTVRRALYRILNEGKVPEPETSKMLERGLDKREGYFTVSTSPPKRRSDRLAELEEEVAQLRTALAAAGLLHDELRQRVEALEAKPSRQPAASRAAAASWKGPRPR